MADALFAPSARLAGGASVRQASSSGAVNDRSFSPAVFAEGAAGAAASAGQVGVETVPQGAALLSTSILFTLAETRTQEALAAQNFPAPSSVGLAIGSYTAAAERAQQAIAVRISVAANEG